MQFKSLLLSTIFSFVLSPFAMAESAEDLFNQGVNAYKQGNYTQAAKLYEQACNGGAVGACYPLALLYEDGQGVEQNYAQAAKLWDKACNGGYAGACNNLGVLYKHGQGKRQDLSSAKEYFAKACDLENQTGCYNYKKLNQMGVQ